jgi:hypothetical protein
MMNNSCSKLHDQKRFHLIISSYEGGQHLDELDDARVRREAPQRLNLPQVVHLISNQLYGLFFGALETLTRMSFKVNALKPWVVEFRDEGVWFRAQGSGLRVLRGGVRVPQHLDPPQIVHLVAGMGAMVQGCRVSGFKFRLYDGRSRIQGLRVQA